MISPCVLLAGHQKRTAVAPILRPTIAQKDDRSHQIDPVASLVCESEQVVDQAGLIVQAVSKRMSRSALPGGTQALVGDLIEPAIRKCRKDGKGTARYPGVCLPADSPESFQIALEDWCIKCVRVICFDPE
jgi:hypothetical protein